MDENFWIKRGEDIGHLKSMIRQMANSRCEFAAKFGSNSADVYDDHGGYLYSFTCQDGKATYGRVAKVVCIGGPDEYGSVHITGVKLRSE